MMSWRTPATLAGIAVINTVEARQAVPPGMYKPTRSSGVTRQRSRTPGSSNWYALGFSS